MKLGRNLEINVGDVVVMNSGDNDDWGWIFEDTTLGYDD